MQAGLFMEAEFADTLHRVSELEQTIAVARMTKVVRVLFAMAADREWHRIKLREARTLFSLLMEDFARDGSMSNEAAVALGNFRADTEFEGVS